MSVRDLLMVTGAAGGGSSALNVNEVFGTNIFQGTGAAQSIVNNIDLATHGGMVWQKSRSSSADHHITDTVRGRASYLASNSSAGAATNPLPDYDLASFNNNGFSLGTPYSNSVNMTYVDYVAWTFRKAQKFFDVVTYTGDGANGRQIAHSLGCTPGMVIVKRMDNTGGWAVFHRSLGAQSYVLLNSGAGKVDVTTDYWGGVAPTDTVFTVQGTTNINGATYVAYLFAHDPGGIIQCGGFSIASGDLQIDLGWEPQALLVKRTGSTGDWRMLDTARGIRSGDAYSSSPVLAPNTADPEWTETCAYPNAAGFVATPALGADDTFIYVAIRRNNQAPTSGSAVFSAVARAGTGTPFTLSHGFTPDLWIASDRDNLSYLTGYQPAIFTRLLGNANAYRASTPGAWGGGWGDAYLKFANTGMELGGDAYLNSSAAAYVYYAWRRAPGFYDEVLFQGTAANQNVPHGLGVPPELMIVVNYSATEDGFVYAAPVGSGHRLGLMSNDPSSAAVPDSLVWAGTNPTDTHFTVKTQSATNKYSAFLFASCPGVSKIGSYTGNGGSQNINCGFSAGARFFLVKSTSAIGDWWMFDTARGIVSAADKGLRLNTNGVEITSDAVDPYAAGITVNQEATCSINASGASYIYWAIA